MASVGHFMGNHKVGQKTCYKFVGKLMDKEIRAIIIKRIDIEDQVIGRYVIKGEVSVEIIKEELIIRMTPDTTCDKLKKDSKK